MYLTLQHLEILLFNEHFIYVFGESYFLLPVAHDKSPLSRKINRDFTQQHTTTLFHIKFISTRVTFFSNI